MSTAEEKAAEAIKRLLKAGLARAPRSTSADVVEESIRAILTVGVDIRAIITLGRESVIVTNGELVSQCVDEAKRAGHGEEITGFQVPRVHVDIEFEDRELTDEQRWAVDWCIGEIRRALQASDLSFGARLEIVRLMLPILGIWGKEAAFALGRDLLRIINTAPVKG